MSIQPWNHFVDNYDLVSLGQKIERLQTLMDFGFFNTHTERERQEAQLILDAANELQIYVHCRTLPVETALRAANECAKIGCSDTIDASGDTIGKAHSNGTTATTATSSRTGAR